jgi:hypothetical protein
MRAAVAPAFDRGHVAADRQNFHHIRAFVLTSSSPFPLGFLALYAKKQIVEPLLRL